MIWKKFQEMEFSVVDLETTGLSPDNDEILEICIVQVKNGIIGEVWDSLVQPKKSVPLAVTKIHGINHDMLMVAPSKRSLVGDVEKRLNKKLLVEHSQNNFDSRFVENFLGHKSWLGEVSTLDMARILLPGLNQYNLKSVCESQSIELKHHHTAKDDACATAHLFIKLIEKAKTELMPIEEIFFKLGIPME